MHIRLYELGVHDVKLIPWWRQHKEIFFLRYWPFVRGIHRSPVNSPHKGQWRRASIFPLICAWIYVWANNRETVDLRRHRAQYDVTVILNGRFFSCIDNCYCPTGRVPFSTSKMQLVHEQLVTVWNGCCCPSMVGISYIKTKYLYRQSQFRELWIECHTPHDMT